MTRAVSIATQDTTRDVSAAVCQARCAVVPLPVQEYLDEIIFAFEYVSDCQGENSILFFFLLSVPRASHC
jgi:hypothetical protein